MIKRLIGGNSDGVIVGLSDSRDITSAARTLLVGGHGVLVESLIPGTELRLHFLSGVLHRAYVAEPYTITGNGTRSLRALISERYPKFLDVMTSSGAFRRRLVMCLWGLGVRKIGDIDRIVPAQGRVVRISAATGAGMQRVDPGAYLVREDVARIERFLRAHGSPSCGIDVIVSEPRTPLAQGGAILEINVPCGFMYLDDPAGAVATDLDAAIAGDSSFRRDKGRVPVMLVMEDDPALAKRSEAMLRAKYNGVTVGRLDASRSNWLSLLNQPDADALLISVSDAAILAHGIPVNLAPRLVHTGARAAFVRAHPLTCATVRHAKGKVGAI